MTALWERCFRAEGSFPLTVAAGVRLPCSRPFTGSCTCLLHRGYDSVVLILLLLQVLSSQRAASGFKNDRGHDRM